LPAINCFGIQTTGNSCTFGHGTEAECLNRRHRPRADRRKVEPEDVRQALTHLGSQARYSQLSQQIMTLTECSKRTAQMAITAACQQGCIVQVDGHYCVLPAPASRVNGQLLSTSVPETGDSYKAQRQFSFA
jgi:hypothetical protein